MNENIKFKRIKKRRSMYAYSDGQFLFDRTLMGLSAIIKGLIKLVIYAPLWFMGYVISTRLLDPGTSGLVWIGMTALFGIVLYQVIFFLKGLLIGWMEKGNFLWIPLFLFCVAFTCIAPCWYFFDTIHAAMTDLSPGQAGLLTWISVAILGILIYSRYLFHLNSAPAAAYPVFQLGITLACADTLAGRSARFI